VSGTADDAGGDGEEPGGDRAAAEGGEGGQGLGEDLGGGVLGGLAGAKAAPAEAVDRADVAALEGGDGLGVAPGGCGEEVLVARARPVCRRSVHTVLRSDAPECLWICRF
jgi:hypothetical protein